MTNIWYFLRDHKLVKILHEWKFLRQKYRHGDTLQSQVIVMSNKSFTNNRPQPSFKLDFYKTMIKTCAFLWIMALFLLLLIWHFSVLIHELLTSKQGKWDWIFFLMFLNMNSYMKLRQTRFFSTIWTFSVVDTAVDTVKIKYVIYFWKHVSDIINLVALVG